MSTLLFRNKRLFALTILMIISAGVSGLMTIGRQEDPTITNLFATIVTPYPGAGPARVEALVTEKIEEELRQIDEIDEFRSSSRSGISVVQVELSQFISDAEIDQAWSKIRDALSDAAAGFPPGVPEPTFDDDRTGAFTAISAITASKNRSVSDAVKRRYAELLQDRLRALSGTKFVRLYGAKNEEILVKIDHRRLASLGLTVDQVSTAITRADSKVSAGQVRGQTSEFLIEVSGEITSLERVARIPVLDEARDGRIVRIADVASVSRAVRQPASSIAYADGKPAVLIAARMQDDLQVDAWMAKITAVYDGFRRDLPASLQLEVLFDQSQYTAERLTVVLQNLAIGVSLVVGVLFLTLGWRAALIVAVILPLASLISISGLRGFGIPIHQMSVTGLIVALGLLVDAGIVMTDNIQRRLVAGSSRLEAVRGAVHRLAVPLLASTLTTALAFMPMALLPGPAGDFVGAIAIAVIIMLTASLVLALTITPALSGWLLRASDRRVSGQNKHGGLFGWSIGWSLAHPRLAIMAALILPAIGFGAFPTLKAQFFPGVDRNQFYVQVKLPDGAAIQQTEQVAMKVDRLLRQSQEVRKVDWVVGESAPAFYYNMIADRDNQPSFAEALVTTASPKATEAVLGRMQRTLDAKIPEAQIIVRGLVQGPPVNAPVEIRVVGPELSVLRTIGEKLRRIMISVPDIILARTELASGAPKVVLDLDEEKVRLAGLQLNDVARQLEATLEGATGGSLLEGSEELPVRVRVGANARADVTSVRNIDVIAPGSAARPAAGYPGIPITSLGTLNVKPAETSIYRRNGERINTIQGFVHRNVLPEEALKMLQARIAEANIKLPPGYRFELGGDSDARDDVLRNLISTLGIILGLSVATIVITFGSYRLSIIAAAVAVLSMGLSLLALAIFGYPFGIQAVIGVIGSIGVSINAAIIIMTALQEDPIALGGDIGRIRDLVVAQSRHIVSTTLTTFGGFLPLILGGGGFWPPFAMSIAGGVLLSTVISFYFTPPAFALLARKGRLLNTASGPAMPAAAQSA
ncbi:MAG: efflux RND transporter permease subunit [Hyphomicrobiaceae bacterium]